MDEKIPLSCHHHLNLELLCQRDKVSTAEKQLMEHLITVLLYIINLREIILFI